MRNAGGLSYSRLRELLLDKIAKLGFDPALFGMHSLPAGGAIAAANAGVQDTLFKWHGHWKSESAKDGYGKDSAQRRLEVSKGLGIFFDLVFVHLQRKGVHLCAGVHNGTKPIWYRL